MLRFHSIHSFSVTHAFVSSLLLLSMGASAADEYPKDIPQPDGKILRLERPPRRIVSLTLGTDEILLDLIDPRRIAALSAFAADPEYSNVLEKSKTVERKITANAEQVVALNPDLIFAASYTQPDFLKLVRGARLPVYLFQTFDSMDEILSNTISVGEAVGERAKARALVDDARARIERVRKSVAGRPRSSVLAFSFGWVAGKGTTIQDIIEAAGGENYAAGRGVEGNKEVAMESLLSWNPDLLLLPGKEDRAGGFGDLPRQFPAVAQLKAAREGRILIMGMYHLSPVNHYIADGVEAMGRLLHPESFPSFSSGPGGGSAALRADSAPVADGSR